MSRSPLTVTPIATGGPSRVLGNNGRFYHSPISPTTLSLMREMAPFDTVAPQISWKWAETSPVAKPCAVKGDTISPIPVSRR